MESNNAVIMELGAQHCSIGFSSDKVPRASILTLVGRPKDKVAQRIPDLREHYVGEEAQLKSDILHVRHSIRRGMVDSWDDMLLLWRHAFKDLLRIKSTDYPVLLTEPPLIPPINREKMTQMLFETLEVPAMYVGLQHVLTLLSVGNVSGVVLDAGFDSTYIVPIYDGSAEHNLVKRVDIGGDILTTYMARLLKQKGLSIDYSKAMTMKQDLCYVALDYQNELMKLKEIETNYELPDGQVVQIGEERFQVAEAFFKPSLLPVDSDGIHKTLHEKINQSQHSKIYYDNIILAGGSSRFSGFSQRLHKELTASVNEKIFISDPLDKNYNEPSAWLGGAILATLPSFKNMWITRQEYDEQGPSVVHRKCQQFT